MVKALKAFRTYVLYSKIIVYIPTSSAKDILVQPDNDGKRGRWIDKIQEFDLEIKPTKLIKGKGLAKIMAESNLRAMDINFLQEGDKDMNINELDERTSEIKIEEKFVSSEWYINIVSYLLTLKCLSELSLSKGRTLNIHAVKYCIV
jgi:hypothetical protein